jgi:hypothetical protein
LRDQLAVAQVQFNKDDDFDSLSKLAGRMLEALRTSPVAQPVGHVIGIEEELRGSIIPGVPDLLGRIDLLIETDDAVIIADLKTSRSRWSRDQAEDAAEQLLLYSELVKALVPDKQMRLQFVGPSNSTRPAAASPPASGTRLAPQRPPPRPPWCWCTLTAAGRRNHFQVRGPAGRTLQASEVCSPASNCIKAAGSAGLTM